MDVAATNRGMAGWPWPWDGCSECWPETRESRAPTTAYSGPTAGTVRKEQLRSFSCPTVLDRAAIGHLATSEWARERARKPRKVCLHVAVSLSNAASFFVYVCFSQAQKQHRPVGKRAGVEQGQARTGGAYSLEAWWSTSRRRVGDLAASAPWAMVN